MPRERFRSPTLSLHILGGRIGRPFFEGFDVGSVELLSLTAEILEIGMFRIGTLVGIIAMQVAFGSV